MEKILIVTTHTDIEERLVNMIEKGILPKAHYSAVVEFFGEEIKESQVFDNFFPFNDLRNKEEIEAALESCKNWGPFDHVISTDEYSVVLTAEICEYINHEGMKKEDVLKFRDKVVMKESIEGRIRTPQLYQLDKLKHNDNLFPVIVKPRSYAGSKGISILYSQDDLKTYLANNISDPSDKGINQFTEDDIEFEEYINGPVYHIDGYVFNNKIEFCRASKYEGLCLNYLDGEPLGSISVGDKKEDEEWRDFAEQVHSVMNIPDGVFHLEAFLTDKGEKVFLEIGIRPGGSLVVPAIEGAIGLNLDEAHVQCQMGIKPNIKNKKEDKNYGWLIFPKDFSSKEDKNIQAINMPTKHLESVSWSEKPQLGTSLNGHFSYINNLGSFLFVSADWSNIKSDLELLLNEYTVK